MSIDWRKDEIVFENEELEEAIYKFAGNCYVCGQRTFVCTTQDRADKEIGERLAAFVPSSPNEPATIYCQKCVLTANPNIAQHVVAGIQAMEANKNKSEFERYLEQMTAALGGR